MTGGCGGEGWGHTIAISGRRPVPLRVQSSKCSHQDHSFRTDETHLVQSWRLWLRSSVAALGVMEEGWGAVLGSFPSDSGVIPWIQKEVRLLDSLRRLAGRHSPVRLRKLVSSWLRRQKQRPWDLWDVTLRDSASEVV